ncbi:unnamed protein product [Staurois parvus]|uniref:Uncharacterized protein n=1 Tax=Staurois parvus TaxID=386267 RepID=A0ABN9AYM4_9NEOB|nr:unnamed protein product [Staurois parvus]
MQPGRSGKGGGMSERPPPNHTRPHALNMGGCFGVGGLPPKAPCPHVDGDKGLFPTTLAGGCGGLRAGGLSESGSPL